MKFRIFTFQEIIYKWLSYSTVFVITTVSIVFYLLSNSISGEDKNLLNSDEVTFILSVLYALFLFIISIYMNSMSNKTQNLFYRRKDQYKYLKRLSDLYSVHDFKDKDIFSFIFMNRGFTGRTNLKIKPYIKQDGFQFTTKYLQLENSFLEQWSDLQKEWNNSINTYIQSQNLKTNVMNVFIHDLEEFLNDVDSWMKDSLDLTTEQSRLFNSFIDRLRSDYKKKFRRFEITKKKMKRIYNKTSKMSKANILRLEKVYGDKLTEILNAENNLLTNLEILENLIKELKDNVPNYDDIQEIAEEHSEKLKEYIYRIDTKLEKVSENVEEILESRDF